MKWSAFLHLFSPPIYATLLFQMAIASKGTSTRSFDSKILSGTGPISSYMGYVSCLALWGGICDLSSQICIFLMLFSGPSKSDLLPGLAKIFIFQFWATIVITVTGSSLSYLLG